MYAEILYSPVGKTALMNGTTLTKAFVALPGGGTAIYNSSGLAYYRHADWLGSSRLASTFSRTLYSSTAYAPFGEQYAIVREQPTRRSPARTQIQFPACTTFSRAGLAPLREGGSRLIPLALRSGSTTPQTWNRYAYVGNNPLNSVDTRRGCFLRLPAYAMTPSNSVQPAKLSPMITTMIKASATPRAHAAQAPLVSLVVGTPHPLNSRPATMSR